jgi:two-component system, LytTR family, sensor kinase
MKNKISLKLWLGLSCIMILQGMLSTFSSYVYFLNTQNSVSYFELLSQRIFSYAFWIILIPFIYFVVTSVVKEKIRLKEIVFLILAGIMVAVFHRLSVVWINDQILSTNPSQNFLSELLKEKYYFLSLCYDSFFSYALLVIFIQIYRISILKKEAQIKEESFRKQLANAEIKNLKMKFQPHFIFNSLHSISAAAYKNPQVADSMISKLSELLRYSINTSDNNFTTVEEELELAKKYMEIQKLRFGDRINYVEKIDANALKEKIPLFVFQPLLENCIKHSVELTDEKINVITNVSKSGSQLVISITNNLPDDAKSSDKSLGEGIKNLSDRLNYIYNGKHKFEAGKNSQSEFQVTILLPLINEQ